MRKKELTQCILALSLKGTLLEPFNLISYGFYPLQSSARGTIFPWILIVFPDPNWGSNTKIIMAF